VNDSSIDEAAEERHPVLGWAEKKIVEFALWRCPSCDRTWERLSWGADKLAKCQGCEGSFSEDQWRRDATEMREVAVCRNCGSELALTSWTVNMETGCHHVCAACGNVVAVVFADDTLQPKEVLDLRWNSTLFSRSRRLDGWSFGVCRYKRDYAVARLLNWMARDEDSRFLYGRDQDHKVGVAFDDSGYFGYVMWTFRTLPVLRQIFVLPERQRSGIGTRMVSYWAERFAFPYAEQFGVEDPNEKSMGLLLKLGYFRMDGESIMPVRAFRIPWGFE
jgi:GNAT superfamily N-acetyltransferase